MKVVMFCENCYVKCEAVQTAAEAAAFARGFIAGAYAYDDGPTVAVYTLPDDQQRMVEEQPVGEVIRALKATSSRVAAEAALRLRQATADPRPS